jgi:hypothetical protein
MIRSHFAVAFGLIGLAALAAAGYFFFPPSPADVSAIVLEEPERELGKLVLGRDYEVEYRVYNRSGHSLRVVGSLYD